MEDHVLDGTDELEYISTPLQSAVLILMGCVSKKRALRYLNFGGGEGGTRSIDLALAEL